MQFLKDGRVQLISGTLLTWAALLALFASYGYEKTWALWGVHPGGSQFFFDWRLIPGTVDTLRMGLDPTVENPGDPDGRIFNYPPIWYLLLLTGISQGDTLWIGILMIVMYFVGVFLFPERIGKMEVLLMLLVLFSPAAMMLYERGNVDLAIFFLCALAVTFAENRTILSAGLIFCASLLKLFPFVGMIILASKGRRTFFTYLLASALLFGLYIFFTTRNVETSWNATMRGRDISYGTNVVVMYFAHFLNSNLKQWIERDAMPLAFKLIAYIPAVLILLASFWSGLRTREKLSASSQRNLNAFWMGAAIYVSTFLLGNNWDYRLAFLIFVIPQLLEWSRLGIGWQRALSIFALACVLISCWYLFYNRHPYDSNYPIPFVFDEIINWALFGNLTYLLANSMPEWLTSLIQRPVSLIHAVTS
ncbi:MAG: hypothetical protein AB1649_12475 [Chloroflexota bacterium]